MGGSVLWGGERAVVLPYLYHHSVSAGLVIYALVQFAQHQTYKSRTTSCLGSGNVDEDYPGFCADFTRIFLGGFVPGEDAGAFSIVLGPEAEGGFLVLRHMVPWLVFCVSVFFAYFL